MKFNWGWGIAIFFTLFAGFIMYSVYRFSNMKEDLVSDDYYNKELAFQQNIDAAHNSIKYSEKATCVVNKEGDVEVALDGADLSKEGAKAHLVFYKPNEKADDFALDKTLSSKPVVISMQGKAHGRWVVFVSWQNEGHKAASQIDINR
jgi:hypothetical protein